MIVVKYVELYLPNTACYHSFFSTNKLCQDLDNLVNNSSLTKVELLWILVTH